MLKLTAAKRRHLLAAYANLCDALQRLEEACVQGRSPTGTGAPLTPLSPVEAEQLLQPLHQLRVQMRDMAANMARDELRHFETAQPRQNTLVWVSNLLDVIRHAVDSLQPAKMRRYGPNSEQEKHTLEALHRDLYAYVHAARELLDSWNQGSQA